MRPQTMSDQKLFDQQLSHRPWIDCETEQEDLPTRVPLTVAPVLIPGKRP